MVRSSPASLIHRCLAVHSAAASKVWSATLKIPELRETVVGSTIPNIHDDLNEASRIVSEFLTEHKGKTLVITGAGVSTDSGVKAYRGPEGIYVVNPKHRPILYQELISSDLFRRRYWARGFVGWGEMAKARPNPTHKILSWMMDSNYVTDLITQNVDNLHRAAATQPSNEHIVELHGSLFQVECLDCHSTIPREDFQRRLYARNPSWGSLLPEKPKINPDGDVELPEHMSYATFDIPPCTSCTSRRMKPQVVFFGESIKPHVTSEAEAMVRRSEAVLVVGSSLATYSSYRLVRLASELDKPVGIICQGNTRADALASWKVTMGCTPVLQRVQQQLQEE